METLQHGTYYHIYNRGNNRENLFHSADNYLYFLRLYEKYISPVAETFAWVLMKNHFHLLVRVKDEGEILPFTKETADRGSTLATLSAVSNPDSGFSRPDSGFSRPDNGFSRPDNGFSRPDPTRQFSHLFNAYAQAYNKTNNRTGALFERPFKRIPITSDKYFRHLVVYIHTNPVHHGFTDDFKDYPWSSYGSIISVKPTKLCRDNVIGWFDDKANFVEVHNRNVDMEDAKEWVIE